MTPTSTPTLTATPLPPTPTFTSTPTPEIEPGDETTTDATGGAAQPLQRLRQFTTDIPDAVAPRIRNALDAIATTPRDRLTLIILLAIVGLASASVFIYLLRRRQ